MLYEKSNSIEEDRFVTSYYIPTNPNVLLDRNILCMANVLL